MRQPEGNDHILAVLISRACTEAGLRITKEKNSNANEGITPVLALAMRMRDIRKTTE